MRFKSEKCLIPLPMKKTSTLKPASAVRQSPRPGTLEFLRQFARAAAVITPALPPVVLN